MDYENNEVMTTEEENTEMVQETEAATDMGVASGSGNGLAVLTGALLAGAAYGAYKGAKAVYGWAKPKVQKAIADRKHRASKHDFCVEGDVVDGEIVSEEDTKN